MQRTSRFESSGNAVSSNTLVKIVAFGKSFANEKITRSAPPRLVNQSATIATFFEEKSIARIVAFFRKLGKLCADGTKIFSRPKNSRISAQNIERNFRRFSVFNRTRDLDRTADFIRDRALVVVVFAVDRQNFQISKSKNSVVVRLAVHDFCVPSDGRRDFDRGVEKNIFSEKMKKFALLFLFLFSNVAFAVPGDFVRGEVTRAQNGVFDEMFPEQISQQLSVKILDGEKSGVSVEIPASELSVRTELQKFELGDAVILNETEKGFSVIDRNRIPALIWIIAIFFAVVAAVGKWSGLRSLLGLILSILVIAKFIIPQILSGANPLVTNLIGGFGIATISIYLAHGFRKRTSIAVLATILTLVIAFFVAQSFVVGAQLFGLGSEESLYLQFGLLGKIDLRGLLLGGILIGTIGVLDDVTTTQVASVDEIQKAQPTLGKKDLYRRGFSVGREHIASMINTLALAYISTGLPIFLLLAMNPDRPSWVIFNSEFFAEEIVRTIAGSIALILAVPISTALAAYFFEKNEKK